MLNVKFVFFQLPLIQLNYQSNGHSFFDTVLNTPLFGQVLANSK